MRIPDNTDHNLTGRTLCLGSLVSFHPFEITLQTVYWTLMCNNKSIFNKLSRIYKQILFDYAETTSKRTRNHHHFAASCQLLEKIWRMYSIDIFTMSAISLTLIFRSSKTI